MHLLGRRAQRSSSRPLHSLGVRADTGQRNVAIGFCSLKGRDLRLPRSFHVPMPHSDSLLDGSEQRRVKG